MKFKLLDGTELDSQSQPYFVAELNTSHFGDLNIAKAMITKAKEIGADCVKFQSWTADTLYSEDYIKAIQLLNALSRNIL